MTNPLLQLTNFGHSVRNDNIHIAQLDAAQLNSLLDN